MSEAVALVKVRKTYQRGREIIAAVDDVSLSVETGEFVAVVGPSGSGKTTLLNLIGCLDQPERGLVRIDGVTTNGLSERALTRTRAEKIGFVFQQFFLLPSLTVRENVELPALFLRERGKTESVDSLLNRLGLSGRAHHRPVQLSGGEMQRVAVARALRNRPKILIADEPTGNLDSQNAHDLLALFRELKRGGLSIVMVTHNTELAHAADRVISMRDGRVAGEVVIA